ncbi:hypothetical protein O1L55_24310 [Streptomyces albulus]|nr:hypothetical protein [Streptomyces noursei]
MAGRRGGGHPGRRGLRPPHPARGRAARMGTLGHGHPDAGAVSLALLLTAVGTTLR